MSQVIRIEAVASVHTTAGLRKVGLALLAALMGAVVLLLGSAGAQAEEPLLVIAEAVFTDRVDPSSRKVGETYDQRAPDQPLYLWMRVKGRRWALDRLRELGKLPIYHKWFRETPMWITPQGSEKMIDEIPLDVGRREVLEKLGWELHKQNYFDWRTWSLKENIRSGSWRVKVVYADNDPVICEDTGKECEFFIVVE